MNAIDVAILTFQFLLLLIFLLSSLSLPSSLVSLDVYHYYHHHYPSHVSMHANLNGAIFIYYRFQYPLNPRSICFNLEPPPSTSTSMYLVESPCLKSNQIASISSTSSHPHPANILFGRHLPPFRLNLIALQRCFAAVDAHRQGTAFPGGVFFWRFFVARQPYEPRKKPSYFQL